MVSCAGIAADRRDDINQHQRENYIQHGKRRDVAQRAEFRIESDGAHRHAHNAARHNNQKLKECGRPPQKP